MTSNFLLLRGKNLGFNDLDFRSQNFELYGIGAIQARHYFENGYGISVVRNMYTAGYNEGTYECAVIGRDGELTYDSGITEDVIGFCDEHDVTHIMKLIQNLE